MTNPPEPSIRPNLYDIPPQQLETALADVVTPSYRIRQVRHWLYENGAESFGEITELPKSQRAGLESHFSLSLPDQYERTPPADDGSQKYLFTLADGSKIESVYMPMGKRTTFCLSSQAGCAVACTFCVTGFFGAGRNLTPAEIVGQYVRLRKEHGVPPAQINVVFMGMGEPLLNVENLFSSLEILRHQLSPRRITISTAGVVPGIEQLSRLEHLPNLAVSINAPDQERRERIMPITRKYPLADLIEVLRHYPAGRGREITFEYVLLAGFNDSPDDARMLAKLLRGIPSKVNAIPFNPDPALPPWMRRPDDRAIDRFAGALVDAGARITVRRSKGDTIAAGCGQLRGKSERRRG